MEAKGEETMRKKVKVNKCKAMWELCAPDSYFTEDWTWLTEQQVIQIARKFSVFPRQRCHRHLTSWETKYSLEM